MTSETMVFMAHATIEALDYDRDRWQVYVRRYPFPTLEPGYAATLIVSARKPHEPTGLISQGYADIPDEAFESAQVLLGRMQSLLNERIDAIMALPEPLLAKTESGV